MDFLLCSTLSRFNQLSELTLRKNPPSLNFCRTYHTQTIATPKTLLILLIPTYYDSGVSSMDVSRGQYSSSPGSWKCKFSGSGCSCNSAIGHGHTWAPGLALKSIMSQGEANQINFPSLHPGSTEWGKLSGVTKWLVACWILQVSLDRSEV